MSNSRSQNVRYVNDVPPTSDPSRRERLLSEIVDHLGDSSLASFSFRTLARSLGVSTYSLVYYFGTREELLSEIVRAIAERQKSAEPRSEEIVSIDDHLAQIRASFEWQLDPQNLKLQRLEFEAATLETPESHASTRSVFGYWMGETQRVLVALGLSPADSAVEARILNNLFYGFQYDLVVNGDLVAASGAFDMVIERYREHLGTIIERSV
jgi:AcrR family transcriptional regulator